MKNKFYITYLVSSKLEDDVSRKTIVISSNRYLLIDEAVEYANSFMESKFASYEIISISQFRENVGDLDYSYTV